MTDKDSRTPSDVRRVGEVLKARREQRQLPLKDVAEALHLRGSIVNAIETGDYARIDGELFLKGYVKSYAQYLGLSPDALLSTLEGELRALRGNEADEHAQAPFARKRSILRPVLWSGVVVAAVVGVYFSLASDETDVRTLEQSTGTVLRGEEARTASEGVDVPLDTSDTPDMAVNETFPAPQSGMPEAASLTSAPVQVPSEASASAAVPESATAPVSEPAAATVDPVPSVSSDIPSDPAETSVSDRPVPPAGEGVLQLTFSGDCWVELINGKGQRVYAGLKRKGDSLDYSGPAPMRLVLGAASEASMMYNGESVDLKRFPTRANRAKVEIGP